ncbi:hypothetical protein KA977_10100, partial [Candidatus Dependentiae bacterium]|nr:hypothetical protein [Candidatus Dependentiae bacterium]
SNTINSNSSAVFRGITPILKSDVVFLADDSINTENYRTNVIMQGNFNPATGEYDPLWNGGTDIIMYDNGTNGDSVPGDHIWTYKTRLKVSSSDTYQWWIGYPVSQYLKSGNDLRVLNVDTIYVKSVLPDVTSPRLSSVSAIDNTHLSVVFNEQIDKLTAENIQNYRVAYATDTLAVLAATLDVDNRTVYLTSSGQTENRMYTLIVSNVKDISGNIINSFNQLQFTGKAALDNISPRIESVLSADYQNINITFSEKIEPQSAQSVLNYFIYNSLNISDTLHIIQCNLDADGKTVHIKTLNQSEKVYKIVINNIKDLAVPANVISSNSSDTFAGKVQVLKTTVTFVADDSINTGYNSSSILMQASFDTSTGKYDRFWATKNINIFMNDSGIDGDQTANDHKWTYRTELEINHDAVFQWWVGTKSSGWLKNCDTFVVANTNPITVTVRWVDNLKPSLSEVNSIDINHISLKFTESVDRTTAENINNYSVSGLTIRSAALLSDKITVVLTSSNQTHNLLYTLVVNNVKDINNNAVLLNSQKTFYGMGGNDTIPPSIIRVNSIDSKTVSIVFSEFLNSVSALNINNYSINGLSVISSVLQSDSVTVILTTDQQTGGYNYKVTVSNVSDSSGNSITSEIGYFIGLPLPSAQITFMADDASNIGSYVTSVRIKGTFNSAGEYSQNWNNNIKITLYDDGINGGDTLANDHIWTYKTNLLVDTLNTFNWSVETLSNTFVYPGQQFNVLDTSYITVRFEFPNRTVPRIVSVSAVENAKVSVIFNKIVTKSTAENIVNYDITYDGTNKLSVLSSTLSPVDNKTVYLITSVMNSQKNYTIKINNITDGSGNVIPLNSSFNFNGVDIVDAEPPAIVSAIAIDKNNVRLIFTENISVESGRNISNYQIYETGNPSQILNIISVSINSLNEKEVVICTADQTNLISYTLKLNNIKDRAVPSNTIISNSSIKFTGMGSVSRALITFIVDDTLNTGNYKTQLFVRGSFNSVTGEYSENSLTSIQLYDNSSNGDIISGDHKFSRSLYFNVDPDKIFIWNVVDSPTQFLASNNFRVSNSTNQNLTVILPSRLSPSNPSVTINGGADTSANPLILLTLSVSNANEMQISENIGFAGAVWEQYVPAKQFILSLVDGLKTVYVRYRNTVNMTYSSIVSDQIRLDIPPVSPSNVRLESSDDGIIKLQWDKSTTLIDSYLIFSDMGSGVVNFDTPVARVSSTLSSWQSPRFGNNLDVKFVVRAARSDGTSDGNIQEFKITAQLPGDFNSDGNVDIMDLTNLAKSYGKTAVDPNWESQYIKFKLDPNTSFISKNDVDYFVQKFRRILASPLNLAPKVQ